MRQQIREMMIKIILQNAPELDDSQIDELTQAWLPQPDAAGSKSNLPPDVLGSMIEQFISYSHGTMKKSVNDGLRKEMGAWPERYWKAFPPVVRQLITDYLKNKISPDEFNSRIGIALEM